MINEIHVRNCIDAYNLESELSYVCDHYREFIYCSHNFQIVKITYCKHWKNEWAKDFIETNNKDYCKKSFVEHLLKSVFPNSNFVEWGSNRLTTTKLNPHGINFNYFYELCTTWRAGQWYNEIKTNDVVDLFVNEHKYTGNPYERRIIHNDFYDLQGRNAELITRFFHALSDTPKHKVKAMFPNYQAVELAINLFTLKIKNHEQTQQCLSV